MWDGWLIPFEIILLKDKIVVEIFTPFNQILIFEEQILYVCSLWIFIFDIDHVQINSVLWKEVRQLAPKNSWNLFILM